MKQKNYGLQNPTNLKFSYDQSAHLLVIPEARGILAECRRIFANIVKSEQAGLWLDGLLSGKAGMGHRSIIPPNFAP
jgi:hypothetical protein